MLKLDATTERLLPGELFDRFTFERKFHGRTLCIVAFGHRLIVDLSTSGARNNCSEVRD